MSNGFKAQQHCGVNLGCHYTEGNCPNNLAQVSESGRCKALQPAMQATAQYKTSHRCPLDLGRHFYRVSNAAQECNTLENVKGEPLCFDSNQQRKVLCMFLHSAKPCGPNVLCWECIILEFLRVRASAARSRTRRVNCSGSTAIDGTRGHTCFCVMRNFIDLISSVGNAFLSSH